MIHHHVFNILLKHLFIKSRLKLYYIHLEVDRCIKWGILDESMGDIGKRDYHIHKCNDQAVSLNKKIILIFVILINNPTSCPLT